MGLDQYAFARKGKLDKPVDFEPKDVDEKFFDWRKHPDLQGWMFRLYESKGGKADDPQCMGGMNISNPVELTADDLDRLEEAVNERRLPKTRGFFFGESGPEDTDNDREFIRQAREKLAAGYAVYYTSWW